MANKFAKDFENDVNRDFGSFAPKTDPVKETEGAKSDGTSKQGSGSSDFSAGKSNSSAGKSAKTSSGTSSGSSESMGTASAKGSLNPAQNAASSIKADVKASMAGGDRDQILEDEKQKNSDPKNVAGKAARNKAIKSGGSKLGKALSGKGAAKAAGAGVGKAAGAFTGIKGIGAGIVSGLKGAGAAVAATVTKAGAAVAGALNVSATVGTAIVLSGTLAATTIPTAGLIGYGVSHSIQQKDGCVPEEYDDPTASRGADAAVEWAIKIANDDSFNYGIKGSHGDPGYASRCGCYFCGTNDTKVRLSGDSRYEKTYVCMTFVTAAYAHGAQDPEVLKICENGGTLDSHDGLFDQVSCFHKIGLMKDLTVDDLLPGDVFVHYASDNQHGHMSIYAGDGRMVDASGGSFKPDSIALRDEGSAERYLKGTWNLEPEKNFVMRYKQGGSRSKVASQSGIVSTTNFASGRVSRNAADVINGACAWAAAVAEDNSFHYGHGQDAHHGGCYFCGTQPSVKKSYLDWEKSYCCNPFVFSAFAHGGGDSDMLAKCQDGNNGDTAIFKDDKHFKDLGHPAVSSWQKGDVLWYNHSGKCHYALYLGDGLLAEAGGSDDNKRNSEDWNDSIHIRKISKYGSFEHCSRYIGVGGSPMFAGALYNDDVAAMTADDGCGGEMDGAEEAEAYVGKGMKKITAANGEEYIILDCDLEAVKKLGPQGRAQCFIYSIGYCDLILGGKFRCSIEGSESDKHAAMRETYGQNSSPRDACGDISKINGSSNNEASTSAVLDKAISEIKAGRPVILWTENSPSNSHFLCVCGWTANSGSKPTWDQLVCIDPAFNGTGDDGLRTMKGYPDGSTHWIGTFENWTPGEGQTRRSN